MKRVSSLGIQLKRIYDTSEESDGLRILVDRLWPRGLSKEKAKLDYWMKEVAPNHELRKSFHQGELNFSQFKEKYLEELSSGEQLEALEVLKKLKNEEKQLTLLFSSKNEVENHAIILKELLDS